MKIADALIGVRRLYIETAPFIYYVEAHPVYTDKMKRFFLEVSTGNIEAVTSVIVLTEALIKPLIDVLAYKGFQIFANEPATVLSDFKCNLNH